MRAPALERDTRAGHQILHRTGNEHLASVGQSRDGVPKATYVVYDMQEQSIELRRLDYDMGTTQKKILDAGLPPRLAERLALGR